MAVDGSILRKRAANVLHLRFLLIPRDGDVAALPGGDVLLQGGIVEIAAAPEDFIQHPLLRGCWAELLLECLVEGYTWSMVLWRATCVSMSLYSA